MKEFSSETYGFEVSEVKKNSEVIESRGEAYLTKEVDDSYESYMGERKGQFNEIDLNESEETERSVTDETPDNLESELNNNYYSYIEDNDIGDNRTEKDDIGSAIDNVENLPEQIKCRNADLSGQHHPETGVPFDRKQIDVDGKQYEVVVPEFESSYDAQLPEHMHQSTDREQFKECNSQFKNEVEANKELREQFDDEQLDQIENGDTPDGYTWHHDAEVGKMQLVETEIHQKTGHTGGRSIWGGGTENR